MAAWPLRAQDHHPTSHIIQPIEGTGGSVPDGDGVIPPYTAINVRHALRADIHGHGFTCGPLEQWSTWTASITVGRIGRGDHWQHPVVAPDVENDEGRTLAKHGAFDVEHVNSDAGIRQNFILHERPSGEGRVEVHLATSGGLILRDEGNNSIAFVDRQETLHMRYNDLCVWDAHGDTLPATMWSHGDSILISVDDALAMYPITVDPLATTAIWSATGGQGNSEFGWSNAPAGDVNGDGYSDIIVGAHVFDNGELNEGRVLVYHGTASGAAITPSWTVESNSASAQFGYSVATAGDVNGDGYSDVIIGAPYLSNGNALEGRVYVYHGSATGLSATPAWTMEGEQDNAYFGRSVACAGDVNGDGYSDVIIGAPFHDNGHVDEGRVTVFLGSATGLASTAAWTIESEQASATMGASVACAGDVNGDGYSDVVIGTPLWDHALSNAGRATVYLGGAGGLAATPNWTYLGDQTNANAGTSVASAGDTNNDGYSDVLVGIPLWDGPSFTDAGRCILALGAAGGPGAGTAYTTPQATAQFGTSVACAGDINGDGYSDVVVGAMLYDGTLTNEGAAMVYFGGTTGLALHATLLGGQANARAGRSVSSAGDVNGDGFSDVLLSAYFYDGSFTNEGILRCFPGAPAAINTTPDQTRVRVNGFARSVSAAGDVNGDGYGDVISGGFNESRAYAYYGSPTGTPVNPSWFYFHAAGGNYGYCVSAAGDVNGDGYHDVIVGTFAGNVVHVFHGSATGLSATPNWTVTGSPVNTRFGFSVAGAGDVNGDGYADVVIGQPGHNTNAGRVLVYHGGPTGLSSTPNWTSAPFDSPHLPGSFYGEGVDGAGDVNGDGYSDVIIGAGGFNAGRGRVLVFHGGPTGLLALPSCTVNGTVSGQLLGSNVHSGACVSSAGDVNGDGYSDVIVASMGVRAYIHHGGPGGLSSVPTWTSATYGGFFAATVASAGDLNADGYSDVIISDCNMGGHIYFGGRHGLGGPIFGAPTNTPDFTYNPGTGLHSASSAGDVNGDGYSDVIMGQYTVSSFHVFYGNASAAMARGNIRLYETDLVTPIRASNLPIPQFGMGLFTRPFLGRTKTRLVWETRIQGEAFSLGSNLQVNNSTAFTAQQPTLEVGAVVGVELKTLVNKPGGGASGITATKVRARVRYDPVTAITGQVFGPWRYMPGYLDGFGTHNNVPLPIELLHFETTCDQGEIRLHWSTASEENSSHFEVQRSRDATTWAEIGWVQAAGHSHQVMEYDFKDEAPLLQGPSYYRLLQVDLDGTTAELPIATAQPCTGGVARIFPNPTTDVLNVELGTMRDAAHRIDLLDAMGRTVITQSTVAAPAQLTLSIQHVPAGAYLLQVIDGRGEALAVECVVKE